MLLLGLIYERGVVCDDCRVYCRVGAGMITRKELRADFSQDLY